jgi:hypothetical protein
MPTDEEAQDDPTAAKRSRRMRNENQSLDVAPVSRTSLFRMKKIRQASALDLHLVEQAILVRGSDHLMAKFG